MIFILRSDRKRPQKLSDFRIAEITIQTFRASLRFIKSTMKQ